MEQVADRPFDWFSDLEPFEKAYKTWQNGTYQQPSLFHLTVKMPHAPFLIAAGAGLLVAEMRRFKPTSPEIVQRLGQKGDAAGRMLFDESFLNCLQRLRFRGRLFAAPEGTFLLPDEPVLTVEADLLQGHLLEFILEKLVGRSTVAATEAAIEFSKKNAPAPAAPKSHFDPSPIGWAERGAAIGGGAVSKNFESNFSEKAEKLAVYRLVATKKKGEKTFDALTQIRRVWRGSEPLADVWLREEHEDDIATGTKKLQILSKNGLKMIEFTRFQNLYQPVLIDGHATFASPNLNYLRQRAARQIEAFEAHGADFLSGWLA